MLARPPTPQFRVGDTNILLSKNAKICVTPNMNAKMYVTPNANRWNIGGVGSPTQNSRLCHLPLRWVANANTIFSGIWSLDGGPCLGRILTDTDGGKDPDSRVWGCA